MIKFGKKSQDIIDIKNNFILDNSKLFQWQKKLYKIYLQQPKRKRCKNCEKKIKGLKFVKFNITYVLCMYCNHLNGNYEDTKSLSEKFYQTSEQESYSKIYYESEWKGYSLRLNKIYLPKAKFLIDSLWTGESINMSKRIFMKLGNLFKARQSSAQVAKNRLQLVLASERQGIRLTDVKRRELREDLYDVISKYFKIEEDSLELEILNEDGQHALNVNTPVSSQIPVETVT